MPRARPYSVRDDADLSDFYVKGLMSVAMIAKRMRRGDDSVRLRIKYLKLHRSEEAFKARWITRMEVAKGRMASVRDAYEPPMLDKDEQHWRLCLSLGGFAHAIRVGDSTVHVYPDRRAA